MICCQNDIRFRDIDNLLEDIDEQTKEYYENIFARWKKRIPKCTVYHYQMSI